MFGQVELTVLALKRRTASLASHWQADRRVLPVKLRERHRYVYSSSPVTRVGT